MLEILLLISFHVDVRLWLVDVDAGGTPVVGEVLVQGQPGPLGGSVGGGGGGGGAWRGGGGRGGGRGGRRHPEGGLRGLLRPVVYLGWSAVVREVDVDLRKGIS